MADYLLLYQGGDPNWRDKRTPEQMQAVMQEWGAWFKELEASGQLRSPGAPLLPEGVALRRDGDGFATDTTMAEVKETDRRLLGHRRQVARGGRLGSRGLPVPQPPPRRCGAGQAGDVDARGLTGRGGSVAGH